MAKKRKPSGPTAKTKPFPATERYELEFFEDDDGQALVLAWLRSLSLSAAAETRFGVVLTIWALPIILAEEV